MNKQGIIVLGGHVQALGIVRAFGRKGLPVIVIDNTGKNISRHSKYCLRSFVVSDYSMKNFLIELGTTNEYQNWIIFPTNDFHVFVLSQNKQILEKYFIVTTDSWDKVNWFYNKSETYRLAERLNIPVPSTFFPADVNDLKNIPFGFPCIVKPAVMHDFYSKVKKKVLLCKNEEELINNYKTALNNIPAEQIIIQDIIPGDGRNQYSACFLFLKGQSYVTLTAVRMRQHPLDFGNATTYAEITFKPVIVEYAEKLLRAVDYNGLCEVEFKYDKRDSQFKLLEVNPRTWKWHSIAEKAGTPFLENFFSFLNNVTVDVHSGWNFASFRHALTDIPVQLKLLFRGNTYALRKKRPVVYATWSGIDYMPWIFEKIYLYNLIKKR